MLTVKLASLGLPKLHSADDNSVIWLIRDEVMKALTNNNKHS